MSFDKKYPNRKDHREEYMGFKKHDRTCRNHGSCSYCEHNRTIDNIKKKLIANEDLQEVLQIEDEQEQQYESV